jgi:hypothetical protein
MAQVQSVAPVITTNLPGQVSHGGRIATSASRQLCSLAFLLPFLALSHFAPLFAYTALGSDGQGPSTRAAMRLTPATVT